MYHTCSQDFYPTFLLADGAAGPAAEIADQVDPQARLNLGIVLGTKPAFTVIAKHEFQEFCQDIMKVAHFYIAVDSQPFVLEKHIVIGGIDRFVAIRLTRSNNPNWRL